MEKTEKQLKQLFSELKTQDSQRVPDFNSVVLPSFRNASNRRTLLRWARFEFAGAAVVLLIVGVAVTSLRARTRSFEKEMHQWAALSNWKAPTDALLSVSEKPLANTTSWLSDFPLNEDISSDTTMEKL